MRYSVIRRGIQLRPHLRFDPEPLWESPVSPATGRATDDLMSMEGKKDEAHEPECSHVC